jgi:hypothetical protein
MSTRWFSRSLTSRQSTYFCLIFARIAPEIAVMEGVLFWLYEREHF